MKKFLIYTNAYKDKNLELTHRVMELLKKRGVECVLVSDGKDWTTEERPVIEVPADAELLVALGGDGTVLQAARELGAKNLPIVGVNLGHLGYLTEIDPDGLEEACDRLSAGDYYVDTRMMLDGSIDLTDGSALNSWALNDIVLARCGSLQILHFDIYVNGQFLHQYHADGMIVTTPTGSTGYNLSAGGPIVEPGAKIITLTPISPHSLNKSSIILSSEDEICIAIPATFEGKIQTMEINFDGGHRHLLHTGDKVTIRRSEKTTELIRFEQSSFLDTLHRKMRDN